MFVFWGGWKWPYLEAKDVLQVFIQEVEPSILELKGWVLIKSAFRSSESPGSIKAERFRYEVDNDFRFWTIQAMIDLLFSTPSLWTSSFRNAPKVSLTSSSVTFPRRTNMAKENISLVHSSRPTGLLVAKLRRWMSGPVANSRKAASSRESPNWV